MAQNQTNDRHAQALTVNPVRLPYPGEVVAKQYNIDEPQWRALVDGVWPSAQTVDGILLALSWCKWRKLDPMKRPCHIVPIWNSKLKRNVEGVWASISEVRITAFRTGAYAGIDEAEWGPMMTKTFEGRVRTIKDGNTSYENKKQENFSFPEWCRHTVYRIVQGQRVAFVGPKVFFLASYGSVQDTELINDKWTEPGFYMLEKCSEAAALRRAFPEEMGDMITAEEMEGRRYETAMEMGAGVTVETPAAGTGTGKAPEQPQRNEPRFQEGHGRPVQDVGDDGRVQPGSGASAGAGPAKQAQGASNAELRRPQGTSGPAQTAQAPKQPAKTASAPAAKPATAAPAQSREPEPSLDLTQPPTQVKPSPKPSPEPVQQRQPEPEPEPELPGEPEPSTSEPEAGAGPDDEATSWAAIDNVGEVTEVYSVKEYHDALAKIIMACNIEDDLHKFYDNNVNSIEALHDAATKSAIYKTYSEKMKAVRAQAQQQAPAQAPQADLKLTIFDHAGQRYAQNLTVAEFVNAADTLFKKAADTTRLEALWRYNSKSFQQLPKLTQDTIFSRYSERTKALSPG